MEVHLVLSKCLWPMHEGADVCREGSEYLSNQNWRVETHVTYLNDKSEKGIG